MVCLEYNTKQTKWFVLAKKEKNMKREEKNENSKEKILQAAVQEFGQKGYVLASTNNICKNNDISKGLLFHYYKTKDELFLICVEKCFDALDEYMKQHMTIETGDTEETLNQFFEIRFNFFKEYPLYEQIFYTAIINTPEHLKQEIEIRREPINQVNFEILTRLMDGLELKPGIHKESVLQMIYGFSNYVQMKYKGDYSQDLEARKEVLSRHSKEIKDMIMMLFYGIVR